MLARYYFTRGSTNGPRHNCSEVHDASLPFSRHAFSPPDSGGGRFGRQIEGFIGQPGRPDLVDTLRGPGGPDEPVHRGGGRGEQHSAPLAARRLQRHSAATAGHFTPIGCRATGARPALPAECVQGYQRRTLRVTSGERSRLPAENAPLPSEECSVLPVRRTLHVTS